MIKSMDRMFVLTLVILCSLQLASGANVSQQGTIFLEMGTAFRQTCELPNNESDMSDWHWIVQRTGDPYALEPINKSHISTNDECTIFFHHVKEFDGYVGYYACVRKSSPLLEQEVANRFRLNVTRYRRRHLGIIPPAEQYVEQRTYGSIHKIFCFFSGNPVQTPDWYHNGMEITKDNQRGFTFESFRKTLVFRVAKDKEGAYECRFPKAIGLDRQFDVRF
uniref:Ig-like domain-containing protein n=1 Tax=Plectus sambesii TaxID=2011161 RepID=A0A914VXC6_9BILA